MRLRNVLVTLALAILLLAGYLVVQGMQEVVPPLPPTWPTFIRKDVSSMTLTLKDADPGTLTLRRKPGASDRWELQRETSWIPAKSTLADDLLTGFVRQDVTNMYPQAKLKATDPAEYKLEPPLASAVLTVGGETVTLRYGRKTAGGAGIYCDGGAGTDVWIVDHGAFHELQSLFVTDPVDDRLFDSLATSDVQAVEILRGEEVAFACSRDQNYIWNVTQPYVGFADPTPFERLLASMVNAQLAWVEFDAPDLAKYGLTDPRMKVRFTDRNGVESVVLLGAPVDPAKPDAEAYVLRPGTQHVGVASPRFVQGLLQDPQAFRDRSFTRLGIDGVRILVKQGDTFYELENAGVQAWDISKPAPRTPADGETMKLLLEDLRGWPILEFADDARPEDHGIGAGALIEIERRDGTLIQLEFGKKAGDAGVYARRGKDGAILIVTRALLEQLLGGPHQFRTKIVRNFAVEDFDFLARHVREDNQEKVQEFKIVRDLESDANAHWVPDGPGALGSFDRDAVARILARFRALQTIRWDLYDAGKAEHFGFSALGGSWFDIEVDHVERVGMMQPEGGANQTLMIGNKAPGGRFARFRPSPGDPLSKFVFILSDEVIQALSQPIFKVPK